MKALNSLHRWLGVFGCGVAIFICSRYIQNFIVPSQRWHLIDFVAYGLIAIAAAFLNPPMPAIRLLLRYFLAFVFLLYGFSKLIDSQFYPLLYRTDKRVHELNGMDIAWVFFGYYAAYKYFLGITQVSASMLLFFRRGTLAGLLVLLPVIVNIVWVNYAFNIPVKFDSCFYLAIDLYLLGFYVPALIAILKNNTEPLTSSRVLTLPALITIVAAAFYLAEKDKGDTAKAPLYGIYDVTSIRKEGKDQPHLKLTTFYFDIAGTLNMRSDSGKVGWADYRLYGRDSISIQTDKLFKGTWHLRKDSLLLEGDWGSKPMEIGLLRRP